MGILSFFKRRQPDTGSTATPEKRAPETPVVQKERAEVPAEGFAVRQSVLVEPIISEKAALLAEKGQYTFRVLPRATKQEVERAVSGAFKVHVERVNMVNIPPKPRRRGRIPGRVSGYRKAIVTLRHGEHIDLTAAGA